MATMAQITAARANARFSTGPHSAEGKAISSKNATRLGLYAQTAILPGEDAEALAAIARAYRDEYRPETPTEEALLHDVVRGHWLKCRYIRIETEVLNARLADAPAGSGLDTALGQVFIDDCDGPKLLEKIFRRQEAADRLFRRAVAGLRLAIAARRAMSAAAPAPAGRVANPKLFLQKRTGFASDPLLQILLNAMPAADPRPLAHPVCPTKTQRETAGHTLRAASRTPVASAEAR